MFSMPDHTAIMILLYLLIFCFMIPVTAMNIIQTETIMNDAILGVVFLATTVIRMAIKRVPTIKKLIYANT